MHAYDAYIMHMQYSVAIKMLVTAVNWQSLELRISLFKLGTLDT